MPDRSKLFLRKHQVENLEFFRSKARAFSLLPFGAGKGPIAVVRIGDLMPCRALIVSTAGMLYKWVREVKTWGHPDWKVALLYGHKDARIAKFREFHHIGVINFDGLRVLMDAVGPEEFARTYNVKIIDEIHAAKNPEGDIALDLAYVCHPNFCDYVYGLTGSPVLESPRDIWPLMRIVSPSVFSANAPGAYERWLERYFILEGEEKPDGTKAYPKWTPRPGAMDELADKLHSISFRRDRGDIDANYPAQQFDKPHIFELRGAARDAYDEAAGRLSLDVSKDRISLVSIYPRLEKLCQLARGWCYDKRNKPVYFRPMGSIEALEDLMETTRHPGRRTVIWTQRMPDMDLISDLLGKMGKSHYLIYGRVSLKNRNKLLRAFNEGRFSTLVAHPLSIGEGLDLEATYSFRYSYRWSAREYDQTIGRVCRMTSEARTVTYKDFIARNTIDAGIIGAVRKKLDIGGLIVRDRRLPGRRETANAV